MSDVDSEAFGRYSFTAPISDRTRTRRRVIARGSAPPRSEPAGAAHIALSARPTREVHVTGLFELLDPEDPVAVTATTFSYESLVIDFEPRDDHAVTGRLPLCSVTRDWPDGFGVAPTLPAVDHKAVLRRGFVLGTVTGLVVATAIAVALSMFVG